MQHLGKAYWIGAVAKGTGEIAANITSVADAASSTSKQAQEASLDTESLRELSVRLEELVRGFQT